MEQSVFLTKQYLKLISTLAYFRLIGNGEKQVLYLIHRNVRRRKCFFSTGYLDGAVIDYGSVYFTRLLQNHYLP